MGPRWLFWPVWPFCHQLLRWKKWRTLHAPTILQGNQPHSTPKPKTMGAKPEETVDFLERMGSNPWNTPKTGALPPALCSWGRKKQRPSGFPSSQPHEGERFANLRFCRSSPPKLLVSLHQTEDGSHASTTQHPGLRPQVGAFWNCWVQ